jgi:hypothetical protein
MLSLVPHECRYHTRCVVSICLGPAMRASPNNGVSCNAYQFVCSVPKKTTKQERVLFEPILGPAPPWRQKAWKALKRWKEMHQEIRRSSLKQASNKFSGLAYIGIAHIFLWGCPVTFFDVHQQRGQKYNQGVTHTTDIEVEPFARPIWFRKSLGSLSIWLASKMASRSWEPW